MDINRKPLQGLCNIIRFNRHFYLIAGTALFCVWLFHRELPSSLRAPLLGLSCLAAAAIAVSLLVSWYVYDRSDIYRLRWLQPPEPSDILNIHAGFDETSAIIRALCPESRLVVCDFYDPKRHTEISIRRARKAYPPTEATISVSSGYLPFPDRSFGVAVVFMSAHEIRNARERSIFFGEIRRVMRPGGRIFVTEHLRDLPNFLAYTVGFFHFYGRSAWLRTFSIAGLTLVKELKTTPFISTFELHPDGNTY